MNLVSFNHQDDEVRYFYAILHQSEGSAFGVTFPDLPGCFSAADTLAEVVPNARDALALWFQEEEWIEPAGINHLSEIAADALADDGVVIAVPFDPDIL